jgi:hypothetical protein
MKKKHPQILDAPFCCRETFDVIKGLFKVVKLNSFSILKKEEEFSYLSLNLS